MREPEVPVGGYGYSYSHVFRDDEIVGLNQTISWSEDPLDKKPKTADEET
jgi:hypothetical protein